MGTEKEKDLNKMPGLTPPPSGAPRSSLHEALETCCPNKLQRSLDKRCDQLVTLSGIRQIAKTRMFQWKRRRMEKEIKQILTAMLTTEHGKNLMKESTENVSKMF